MCGANEFSSVYKCLFLNNCFFATVKDELEIFPPVPAPVLISAHLELRRPRRKPFILEHTEAIRQTLSQVIRINCFRKIGANTVLLFHQTAASCIKAHGTNSVPRHWRTRDKHINPKRWITHRSCGEAACRQSRGSRRYTCPAYQPVCASGGNQSR